MDDTLVSELDDAELDNYIERYEADAVQRRPRLRFVDRGGRACPAAALAGAGSSADFMRGPAGRDFRGGGLERISRAFEDGRLDPDRLYRECLLERTRRSSRERRRESAPSPSRRQPAAAATGT